MIQIRDEENFPARVAHANHDYDEIYKACADLRTLEKGCVTVQLGELDEGKAQRRAHIAFRNNRKWRVITRVRENVLWIRKERRVKI